MDPTEILVTGGAGYIGSTICSALEDAGHTPIILDSLVSGYEQFAKGRSFYRGDIADAGTVGRIFDDHPDIDFAIHCAALTVVPDSVERPYEYYRNNIIGSLHLFRMLAERGCRNIIFSSSASVYDAVPGFMVTEDSPTRPQSPYARSKRMTEMMLEDMAVALTDSKPSRSATSTLSEPTPCCAQARRSPARTQIVNVLVDVARGARPMFQITGTDWPTRDGTGIRDYVHVWDIAEAHVKDSGADALYLWGRRLAVHRHQLGNRFRCGLARQADRGRRHQACAGMGEGEGLRPEHVTAITAHKAAHVRFLSHSS